jgi:hypothetical protein
MMAVVGILLPRYVRRTHVGDFAAAMALEAKA